MINNSNIVAEGTVHILHFLCWKHRGLDPALITELEEQVMKLSALTEQLLLEEFGVQKWTSTVSKMAL